MNIGLGLGALLTGGGYRLIEEGISLAVLPIVLGLYQPGVGHVAVS